MKQGKFFGYHVKASKCQLFVKDEKYNESLKLFKNTEIKKKKDGRVLCSAIESETEGKIFLETTEKTLLDRIHITTKNAPLFNRQSTAK